MSEFETPGVDAVRSPERWSGPTPEFGRFAVATVADRYMDPSKIMIEDKKEALKDLLMQQTEVDIRSIARIEAKQATELLPPQAGDEKLQVIAQWIATSQEWIDYHRANPDADTAVNEAFSSLSVGKNQPLTAAMLYSDYLGTGTSEDRQNIEEAVIQKRKDFMDKMIKGCMQEGVINMALLRQRLLALAPIIDANDLLWATMTEAVFRMPDAQKSPVIDQLLSSVQDAPRSEEDWDLFAELELFSGPTEYQAVSKKGNRVKRTPPHHPYNQDAYFTPKGSYLPEQSFISEADQQLDASLEKPLNEETKEQQAQQLSRLLEGTSYELSADEIEDLEATLKDRIAEGSLQEFAVVADGMGGNQDGEIASSLATVIVTDYVLKCIESADNKQQVLKNAIRWADHVMGELNLRREYPPKKAMGTTLAIMVTDAEGKTHGASVADARIYKRTKKIPPTKMPDDYSPVELLTADGSIVWSMVQDTPEAMPSAIFTHLQRPFITTPIQLGELQDKDIQSFTTELDSNEQLILCSDGVWEGFNEKGAQAKAIFAKADRQFRTDIRNMPRELAIKKACGYIFYHLNLNGISDESRLAEYLTREQVLNDSGDNATVVVVGKRESKATLKSHKDEPVDLDSGTVDIETGALNESAQLTRLDLNRGEMRDFMRKVEIHASPFPPHNGERLTAVKLMDAELTPRYEVQAEGAVINFSRPFEVSENRWGIIGYVKKGNRYIARSYYLSRSHAMWRYLPAYLPDGEGGIEWFSKGHDEQGINAPIVFQEAINRIIIDNDFVDELPENPYFYLAGTAKSLGGDELPTSDIVIEEVPQDIGFKPRRRYTENGNIRKIRPELVSFRYQPENKPIFSKPLLQWKQETLQYGTIQVEVFASLSGLRYMFCRDEKNRVWIGGIENSSNITEVGLKERWIDAGDLVTPADEYYSQTAGYADGDGSPAVILENQRKQYVDMFRPYLSKMPIIQEYMRVRGIIGAPGQEV